VAECNDGPQPQGHARLVGHGHDIARMDPIKEETHHASAPGFWPKEPHSFQF